MNYIGSKYTLLPFIEQVFAQIGDGREQVVCDLFAGTGAVGRNFKRLGLRVLANDLQYYAYALNKAYIELNETPCFERLQRRLPAELNAALFPEPVAAVLALLNRLPGQAGFIANNYGPAGNRLYYTAENAEKADALRQLLTDWRRQDLITEQEFFYLLCSLLEALDQVANTASVYGAFLKKFKRSALKPLQLKPLTLYNHVTGSKVFNQDANLLCGQLECDVLYLDPPYNHRQYGANYHVLETVAAYDAPVVSGVTGLRAYPRSRYCQPGAAGEALADLISKARARHILLSYNDEGVLSLKQIHEILSLRGEPQTFQTAYTRFKADSGRAYKRDATTEYLHYVKVVTAPAAS